MTSVFSSVARAVSLLAAAGLAAAALAAACNNSAPSTGYTPITGIQIQASTIVAGRGCGLLPDQVFKYVAIVSPTTANGGASMPIVSGVFDCFVDGFFSNLPMPNGLSATFDIAILAYNEQSFPSALTCPAEGGLATQPCPGDNPDAALLFNAAANWTTTCTATQVQGGTSQATCQALQPSDAGLGNAGAADATDEADQGDAAGDGAESSEAEATGDEGGTTD